MKRFHIKQLLVKGEGKSPGIIEFSKGLTVISGPSNTGKTCVLRSIDYCFGSSTLPFDESFGYTNLILTVETENGEITFSRELNNSHIHVVSTDPEFDSDIFTTNNRPTKKYDTIGQYWLSLIGIDEPVEVIKNKKYVTQKLSWRTLSPLYFLNEDRIASTRSALLPTQRTAETAFLSSLYFLITGISGSNFEKIDSLEVKEARQKAVQDYAHANIAQIRDRVDKLKDFLDSYEDIDLEHKMSQILKQTEKAELELNVAMNRSASLFGEINKCESELAENSLLLSRYKALESRLVADVKRLTFAENGDSILENIPKASYCPFCDSALSSDQQKQHTCGVTGELNKIVSQLNDLKETMKEVEVENNELKDNLNNLKNEFQKSQMLVENEIKPALTNLYQKYKELKKITEFRHEHEVLLEIKQSWSEELIGWLSEDDKDELTYSARKCFDISFKEEISLRATELLEECNYKDLETVRFNLSKFDLDINGSHKETLQGQGYRAYINTALLLVMREYLFNKGKYSPSLLIFDTPLLGFDETGIDSVDESMKKALFEYMLNHQEEGQVIVVENAINTPELNYQSKGAKHIQFTKKRQQGRYGFLPDIY